MQCTLYLNQMSGILRISIVVGQNHECIDQYMNENMNRTEGAKPICILSILNTRAGLLYTVQCIT